MASAAKAKKFIFVTGGVVSSLGKGITASGVGALLEGRGLRVSFLKLDPYVNVDPGTMNPLQHGEVFVTDDGAETDLDLGHYERFSSARMTRNNNFTSGKIYYSVISRERRGEYLGETVQVIPHITDEIKRCIHVAASDCDVLITEVGGTVGDIESLPFLEAIRQMRNEAGAENTCYVHVTLVPWIATAGELKTKPTQHSVAELRAIGIQPDMLVCRSEKELGKDIRRKISNFCNVRPEHVFAAYDAGNIYEVPLMLHAEGIDEHLLDSLRMWTRAPLLEPWEKLCETIRNLRDEVTIAIVGKYVDLTDAYKSLNEALKHGGYAHQTRVNLRFIDSEDVEEEGIEKFIQGVDGILVPGGFGKRGIEGKIAAANYARTHRIPYFGICLGMQIAVIEFARNVAGVPQANSREFVPDSNAAVIDLMDDQKDVTDKGATMRLGAWRCALRPGTVAARVYGTAEISERHRHRFEFSNAWRDRLEAAGLTLSGTSPDGNLVEMIEIADHPWFVGTQAHPELKSQPLVPHPLFKAFIGAALKRKHEVELARKTHAGVG